MKRELHADAMCWPLKSSVGLEQPALNGLSRAELRIRLAFGGYAPGSRKVSKRAVKQRASLAQVIFLDNRHQLAELSGLTKGTVPAEGASGSGGS